MFKAGCALYYSMAKFGHGIVYLYAFLLYAVTFAVQTMQLQRTSLQFNRLKPSGFDMHHNL